MAKKTLIELISALEVGDDEGESYPIGDISTEDDIDNLAEEILDRLADLKKDVPEVLKFGDDTPIKNTMWNNIIEELDWLLRYGEEQ